MPSKGCRRARGLADSLRVTVVIAGATRWSSRRATQCFWPVIVSQSSENQAESQSFVNDIAGSVRLAVYDCSGRCVRALANGRQGTGRHSARWDGLDNEAKPVEADGAALTRQVILLKIRC